VTTTVNPPRRGGPFPTLTVSWDTQKVGLTAGEVGKQLLAGEPRIMTHASGDGSSLLIRPVALKPEEHKIIAARLEEIFRKAQGPLRRPEIQPPAANIAGRWNVEIEFTRGRTSHLLFLETKGNDVTGTHIGRLARGDAKGAINGSDVKITTQLPLEGSNLPYAFAGRLSGDTITGEVHMGEYRSAKFTARRHASGGGRRDPSKV
jgi:D-glucosaminate-6-phosphate ammonia-lyase